MDELEIRDGVWYDNFGDRLLAGHLKDSRSYRLSGFHLHTTHEIVVVTSGHSVYECGGQSVELHAPFAVAVQPYIPHYNSFLFDEGDYERYILNCPADYVQDLYRWLPEAQKIFSHLFYACTLKREHAETLRPLLERAVALRYRKRQAGMRFAIGNVLEELTSILPETETAAAIGSDGINEIVSYLLTHIGEPLEVSEVAQRFYISESKLAKDFRDVLGISFHQYVLQLRVKRAKDMLDGGVSGTEVARACGFASHSHFIRVFRTYIGVTPGEYTAERKKQGT